MTKLSGPVFTQLRWYLSLPPNYHKTPSLNCFSSAGTPLAFLFLDVGMTD